MIHSTPVAVLICNYFIFDSSYLFENYIYKIEKKKEKLIAGLRNDNCVWHRIDNNNLIK